MRFVLLTTGSRGDVQPFVALAVQLQRAGHSAALAAPPAFRAFVEQHGVCFMSFSAGSPASRRAPRPQAANSGPSNSLAFMARRVREKQAAAAELNTAAWQICQEADAIVARVTAYLDLFGVACRLKIPFFEVGLDPQVRTGAYPNTDFFPGVSIPGGYNRATHWLVEQVNWLCFRAATNRFRQSVLHLPAYPARRSLDALRRSAPPMLNAFSEVVVPRPPDWPGYAQITGFWFLEDGGPWQPPPALRQFLTAGEPPVCVCFGSMASGKPLDTLTMIEQVMDQLARRAVWIDGSDSRIPDGPCGERVFHLSQAPHQWLFPQMAAVVHHGGAGTTAASLRAGVPTITVPHRYDQPFWGRQVERLGAGPKPIPRSRLTAARLAGALETALRSTTVRAAAQAAGEAIRAEHGTGRAVEIIRQYLSAAAA